MIPSLASYLKELIRISHFKIFYADTLATSSSNNTDIINGGEDYSDDQTTMEGESIS